MMAREEALPERGTFIRLRYFKYFEHTPYGCIVLIYQTVHIMRRRRLVGMLERQHFSMEGKRKWYLFGQK